MKPLGLLLIVVGAIWALIAWNMSTTVTGGGERIGSGEFSISVPKITVHNIGLMEERRNHLLGAAFTALAGVILFGFGSLQCNQRTAPPEASHSSEEFRIPASNALSESSPSYWEIKEAIDHDDADRVERVLAQ